MGGSNPLSRAEPTQVVGSSDVMPLTLSLDTSQYADGDVLADTQELANAFRLPGGRAILQSLVINDEDDQGVALDLVFLSANNSLGTENGAPSISDANARDILGFVRVGAGDFIDLGGVRVASLSGLALLLEAAADSTSLYVAAITRGGTPTYTAAGIRIKFGFLKD